MKKYLRSLMFDALLALVLLWGLVSPQSAAMNFVAAWALYVCFVCITASLAGAGWILTALMYLICVLTFKAVRETYRQRIEGAGLCPESL